MASRTDTSYNAYIDDTHYSNYDTSTPTNTLRSVRTNPYCTAITYANTESEYERQMRQKMEDQEEWELYFESIVRRAEFRELFSIERRIKRKVNLPILPHNIIKKTMNRRMMNGRH